MYVLLSTVALLLSVVRGDLVKNSESASLRGGGVAGSSAATMKMDIHTSGGPLSFALVPHRVRLGDADDDDDREHRYGRRRLDRPAQPYSHYEEMNQIAQANKEAGEVAQVTHPLPVNPLYQGYGTHYVDLWVGSPPQRQTVIVDTGSSVTAFPCSDCTSCGTGYHTDTYFQEMESTSFQEVSCEQCMIGKCFVGASCDIGVSYQEGSSWRAFEAVDTVYSGGSHDEALADTPDDAFQLHFGCQTHLTGLFKTQLADGIVGMEMKETSFWHQMYSVGALTERSFSLCFSRQPMANTDGTQAGAMTLGGSDTRLHDTTMVFASQKNDHGWYAVRIKNLFLRIRGGDRAVVPSHIRDENVLVERVQLGEAEINNGNVILDSGTTDTYLSSNLEGPFKAAWMELMGYEYDNESRQMSISALEALPTVLFQLEVSDIQNDSEVRPEGVVGDLDPDRPTDVLVAMPPSHYMEYNAAKDRYTSRLYLNEKNGGVLGANFLMGHDVFFDMENQQVGFAESECDYGLVSDDESQAKQGIH